MKIMPIHGYDDFEMRLKRQDAFWDCSVLDRVCVNIEFAKNPLARCVPVSRHSTYKDRWMDVDFQVELALADAENTVCMGDALPINSPKLGPDFFPALYGGEVIFEDTTSYIKPFLKDWADAGSLSFSRQHPYWLKVEELYAALLEAGRNKFYMGWPDLHPGADCLVGLRGPQEMAVDLYDEPEAIKKMLAQVTRDFFETFDFYYNRLTAAGHPCTGWPRMISTRKWHVPSCDFAYMIGPEQFNEFFLEGIREECNFLEASLFHLDGIGSLKHLDSLLSIDSLSAVQWVWGDGKGCVTDWLDVFKKIQAAGKGIQLVYVQPEHLDCLMENLRPEGVWVKLDNITSVEEGEAILQKISKWI
jgi:hypothetical protein